MGDQFAALRSMGVVIEELGELDRLPARVIGPIAATDAVVPGDTSSQFITGLLLAGGAGSMRVGLTTEPVSRPYIDMTAAVMGSFGAEVEHDGSRVWTVGGGYSGIDYTIEPDASAASYFLAAAAITGGRVRILGQVIGDVFVRAGSTVEVLGQVIGTVRLRGARLVVRGDQEVEQSDVSDFRRDSPTGSVLGAHVICTTASNRKWPLR